MEGTHSWAAPPGAPARLSEFMENGCVPSGTDPACHPLGHSDNGFFNSRKYKFVEWWLKNSNYQCTNDPHFAESTVGVELLRHDSETAAPKEASNRSPPHNLPSMSCQTRMPEPDVSSHRHVPAPARSRRPGSDCNELGCRLATERVTTIRLAQRAFAVASVAESGTLQALDQELQAAYRVLLDCEQRKVMAAARKIAMLVVGGQNGQGVLAAVHAFFQSSQLVRLPPGGPTPMGTPGAPSHVQGGLTPNVIHRTFSIDIARRNVQ